MARVLITGARGFIGMHLARRLASAGHDVCGIGHGIWPEQEALDWGVRHWVNGDLVPSNLRTIQNGFGTPDHVYHLAGGSSVAAALASPREDFFRSVASTAEVLDWIRIDAPGAKLIVVSSAAVYGEGHKGPIPEDSLPSPFSPYGHHKRLMEELCRSYASNFGTQVAVARLFSVFGSGLKKQLLWDMCSRLGRGESTLTLGGTGEELRDWTEVRDVARALHSLEGVASTAMPIYNVGTGRGTPVREIAAAVVRHWSELRGGSAAVRFSGQSRRGDPSALVADAEKLRSRDFKWEVPLDTGLRDYVAWYLRRSDAPEHH